MLDIYNVLEEIIIKPLVSLTLSYLTKSHQTILQQNPNINSVVMNEIFEYQDDDLLIYIILEKKYSYDRMRLFPICAKFGKINNMKWLFENNFPFDRNTFSSAARNGNLDNMKWMLENKFPFDQYTFSSAAENGNLDNIKWLLENKFPFGTSTFSSAARNGNLDNMKWLLENK